MSGAPQPTHTFCVVVPTRDRADQVGALVQRLCGLLDAPEQIVVVDDGSHDDTVARLRKLHPSPVVVASGGQGPATARNLGAAMATTDWLIFLDDDDDPHDDWMATFRHLARSHPSAVYASVGFERDVVGHVTPVTLLESGPAFGEPPANFVAGTFAVRRAVFDEVGGFLEGLRCMEFTDLALRLLGSIPRPGAVVHDPTSRPITIHVRPPAERASQSAEIIERSWELVSERNASQFALDRRFSASQCSTVAVAWLRQGRADRGRLWLWRALRTRANLRDALRLAIATVPPLRRKVWASSSAAAHG